MARHILARATYQAPTDTRGGRWAVSVDGRRKSVPYDFALTYEDNARAAIERALSGATWLGITRLEPITRKVPAHARARWFAVMLET